jgi:FMN reductase
MASTGRQAERSGAHAAGPVVVVGLGGSLAPRSRSRAALTVALRGAAEAGAETELFDVAALGLPLYAPTTDPPSTVVRMADRMHTADGLIWSSPLYHGTISGSFKNALDWLQILSRREPPYLANKVIGLISTAGGVQGLQAVNTMEFVVRALRAYAVPLVITVPQAHAAFAVILGSRSSLWRWAGKSRAWRGGCARVGAWSRNAHGHGSTSRPSPAGGRDATVDELHAGRPSPLRCVA